jgi:Vacuolar sorting protein 39 domain 2.
MLQVYNQGSAGCDEVYVLLMKMLITPPDSSWLVMGAQSSTVSCPPTSDLETALSVLEKHASKIHPMKALRVLPDKVPLGRIRQFLEVSLQNKLNERRRAQVLKGLIYAEHLQVLRYIMNCTFH